MRTEELHPRTWSEQGKGRPRAVRNFGLISTADDAKTERHLYTAGPAEVRVLARYHGDIIEAARIFCGTDWRNPSLLVVEVFGPDHTAASLLRLEHER